MQGQCVYIETQIEYLRIQIESSSMPAGLKTDLLQRLRLLVPSRVEALTRQAHKPLSSTGLRYILCFYITMDVRAIASLFNVDTGTVYSVRYRLRKQFPSGAVLPF